LPDGETHLGLINKEPDSGGFVSTVRFQPIQEYKHLRICLTLQNELYIYAPDVLPIIEHKGNMLDETDFEYKERGTASKNAYQKLYNCFTKPLVQVVWDTFPEDTVVYGTRDNSQPPEFDFSKPIAVSFDETELLLFKDVNDLQTFLTKTKREMESEQG